MSVEKSYMDFIVLHEKKLMSKDVNSLENDITSTTNRVSSILGALAEEDLQEATEKLMDGLDMFKKVLIKHKLYDV